MVFASNNKSKLKEVREMLGSDIKSLSDMGIDVDVEENGTTFYENASIKAHAIYDICHEPVIADDSGIMLDALDGFPGVMTARFLGENATVEEKNDYLVSKVVGLDNTCHVMCTLVYYDGEKELVGNGDLVGHIVSPRGDNGFGFDSIVELEDGRTVAELTSDEKNKISARYMALKELKSML